MIKKVGNVLSCPIQRSESVRSPVKIAPCSSLIQITLRHVDNAMAPKYFREVSEENVIPNHEAKLCSSNHTGGSMGKKEANYETFY